MLFTIAAGPRQSSHSWVQVLWDLQPYFTISDLILPFSSPPMTHKVMVEVFDTALPLYGILNWLPKLSSLKPLCTDRLENTVSNNNYIVTEACLPIYCIAMAVVSLFVLRSLPSNRSICHIIHNGSQSITLFLLGSSLTLLSHTHYLLFSSLITDSSVSSYVLCISPCYRLMRIC
jgi:hypothetical protein